MQEGAAVAGAVPRRMDHVQGLRGLAMAIIVVYHCDLPPSGGFVALDAFFVISGYVIGGLLLREHLSTGRVRFGRFYLRRIRRLLPALALTLVVVAALSLVFESPLAGQRVTGRVGMYGAVSLANLALYTTDAGYFAPSAGTVTLRHLWSLSVEEQIYLVFPLFLVVVLAVFGRRLRALGWAVVAASVVSFVVLVVLAYAQQVPLIGRPRSAAYYFPITRVWEFGAGALLAIWHTTRPAWGRRATSVGGAVGVVLSLAALLFFDSDHQSSSPALVVPVAGSALMLMACRSGGVLARVLSWRPLCWIGDRSYGWYLWHWPLIVLAKVQWPDDRWVEVAAALVALGVTTVSYRFVEQRFRYPRRAATPRQQTRSGVLLAAVCFLVPLLAMGALRVGARHDWGSDTVRAMARQVSALPPGSRENGCRIDAALRSDSIAACTVDSGKNPIYLLGDSNAGQWADGLVVAARSMHRPVVLGWRPGCAFVAVTVERPGYDAAACDRYNGQMTQWLQRHPGGRVVLASANEYIPLGSATLRDPTTGDTSATQNKAYLWSEGLRRSIESLQRAGFPVTVLATLPHPGGVDRLSKSAWEAQSCSMLTILRDVDECGITVSLRAEDARQRLGLEAERRAVALTDATYLDLRATVCPDGVCATVRNGTWIYRNSEHITVGRSRELAGDLIVGLSS